MEIETKVVGGVGLGTGAGQDRNSGAVPSDCALWGQH